MDKIKIEKDIDVVYLPSPDFPNNVPVTYKKLHALLPDHPNRRYFGISHPDKTGVIQYKACAEVLSSDTIPNSELQKFKIEKGNFATLYIVNHFQDGNNIGNAFKELLKHPKLDPKGYCLEVYKNYTDLDVHCMVRIIL
ncbi:MAG: hypothetical protein KBD79_14225 [Chitinophagales bacterium]|nr:hypothetical protein [Chitinophagales bacterium]